MILVIAIGLTFVLLVLSLVIWIIAELLKVIIDLRALRVRDDAEQIMGFDNGKPVTYYLCAVCENRVLVETNNPRVVKCERCGRMYSLREEDVLIRH